MKPHSTGSCFATYLLPHVLFVADFEERQRIAKVCCLAWNIALFPDAAERERQTEQVLLDVWVDTEAKLCGATCANSLLLVHQTLVFCTTTAKLRCRRERGGIA